MTYFENVTSRFNHVSYMRQPQAELLRDFVIEHDSRDVLEIGFCHGKSSAYFAAILEDLGRGQLVTIDRDGARNRTPNIEHLLSELDLRHRVTPVYADRSYTWELSKLIRATPRPQFDLCYFDGGHTWDSTGFGFLLVDLLLRPGGWIIFDDLQWTIDESMRDRKNVPKHWLACGAEERATPAVQLVFDLLVPHLGYTDKQTTYRGQWGIARKPVGAPRDSASAQGRLSRFLAALRRR